MLGVLYAIFFFVSCTLFVVLYKVSTQNSISDKTSSLDISIDFIKQKIDELFNILKVKENHLNNLNESLYGVKQDSTLHIVLKRSKEMEKETLIKDIQKISATILVYEKQKNQIQSMRIAKQVAADFNSMKKKMHGFYTPDGVILNEDVVDELLTMNDDFAQNETETNERLTNILNGDLDDGDRDDLFEEIREACKSRSNTLQQLPEAPQTTVQISISDSRISDSHLYA